MLLAFISYSLNARSSLMVKMVVVLTSLNKESFVHNFWILQNHHSPHEKLTNEFMNTY